MYDAERETMLKGGTMSCTTERHVWFGSGSTSSAPLMNEWCACGALKHGDISPIVRLRRQYDELAADNGRLLGEIEQLRVALEQIASQTIPHVVGDHHLPYGIALRMRTIAMEALAAEPQEAGAED